MVRGSFFISEYDFSWFEKKKILHYFVVLFRRSCYNSVRQSIGGNAYEG